VEKILLVDEAWTLLKSPATARFLENIARTARKARLALVVVSQQLTDLDGPSGKAILAQATTKIGLAQDADALRQAASLLGLTPREAELYGSLSSVTGAYSELFVKSPAGSGVARLVLDPLSYWISTSDRTDNLFLDDLRARALARGLSEREALRAALLEAGHRHPHGIR
jgi:conjugal transfer ATP-binding protein TraC